MISIIEGCGNNIASLQFALARLGVTTQLTSDPRKIEKSTHVILPGVGSAKNAMLALQQRALIDVIQNLKQPVLGICLGMQLLFETSEEGNVDCLGLISGKIRRFTEKNNRIVPHMGWNQLRIQKNCPLLKDIEDGSFQYFAHSYFAPVNEFTVASTDYEDYFSAVVQNNNFFGTQFHPEKSGKIGTKILKNFIELDSRLRENDEERI